MLCPKCKEARSDTLETCPADGFKLIRNRAHQRWGRYLLSRFLGVGGAGATVWAADDLLATKPPFEVAIKLLPVEGVDKQEHLRFERGAVLAESLNHHHVAQVLEHGRMTERGEEMVFQAMVLLEGDTLAAALAGRKRYSPKLSVALMDGVMAALEATHRADIIHRDLKPSNVFLTPAILAEGTEIPWVRVLDFGIARLTNQQAAERFGPLFPDDEPLGPELGEEVTDEHRVCGTPEYMAPEQILGGVPDPRSDLYAVGVMLYRMVSGVLPFRAKTRYDLYRAHMNEAPPAFAPDLEIPKALSAVIAKALAKQPEQRFESAAQMRDAMRRAVGLEPIERPRLFPEEFDHSEAQPALMVLPTSEEIAVDELHAKPALSVLPRSEEIPLSMLSSSPSETAAENKQTEFAPKDKPTGWLGRLWRKVGGK